MRCCLRLVGDEGVGALLAEVPAAAAARAQTQLQHLAHPVHHCLFFFLDLFPLLALLLPWWGS